MMLYPRPCMMLDGIDSCRLAGNPYTRGRGETGVESTSNSLRV